MKSGYIIALILYLMGAMTLYSQQKRQGDPLLDSLFLLMNTDPDMAIKLGTELYNKYKGNPKKEISALTIIGSSYSVKKDYETAIEYALKTREISRKINDYATQIQVAGFIGEKYHNLNINTKAKYYFDEAYDLIEKYPLPDSLKFYKGNLLYLKALIYRDELGCEFATPYYKRALDVYLPLLPEREILRFSIGDIYNEKGYCFLESNQMDSATLSFKNALKYASNGEYSLINAESHAGIARVFYLRKEFRKAEKEFQEVVQIIKLKKVENINPLVYQFISDNYYALNDIENYTYYLNLYKQKTQTEISAKRNSVNEIVGKTGQNSDEKDQQGQHTLIIMILLFILLVLVAVVIYQITLTKHKIKKFKQEISRHDQGD